jgi:toxin ParE1/3/4
VRRFPEGAARAGHPGLPRDFLKPYRILYRVIGNKVYVLLIADGRRDVQTLLQRRLLGA